MIFVTPYLYFKGKPLSVVQDLISKWAEAVSIAPRTEEVARMVVGMLLRIAAYSHLRPSLPVGVWL